MAFSSSGALLRSFDGSGGENGQFTFPVALSVDAAARQVLVVDHLNFRAQILDLDGNFVSCFGRSQGSDCMRGAAAGWWQVLAVPQADVG